jgi:plasmid stabilization system protein ParE
MGPRRRRIVWSEGAIRELDEATEYVAADSPQNAVRLLERVLHAAASLAELSERGRVLPELREPLVREDRGRAVAGHRLMSGGGGHLPR